RLEDLHYWSHPTLSQDQLRQGLTNLLQHATEGLKSNPIMLSVVNREHISIVEEVADSVEWQNSKGDRLYVLDAAVPVKDIPVGATWEVDGVVFEMDMARNADAPILTSQTNIDYGQAYILKLINHPVVSKLMRVVRLASTKEAVSWSLVHTDLSIGLLSTLPEYRRKGLVQRALASTVIAFRETMASFDGWLGVEPHSFVGIDNIPSQNLMSSMGFKESSDSTFVMMSVVV
ncbi:unnamed protein product, partial [Aphanomyces euteiches]